MVAIISYLRRFVSTVFDILPLGIIFLFVIQIITGVLLAFYYEPSARPAVTANGEPIYLLRGKAHVIDISTVDSSMIDISMVDSLTISQQSMNQILQDSDGKPIRPSPAFITSTITLARIPFGRIVRGVHHWAAHSLIAGMLVWFALSVVTKSYRRVPVWFWGASVFGVALFLIWGWTGYVLRWNLRSLIALEVVFASLPQLFSFVGVGITALLRGAPSVAPETLTRIFALHVMVCPVLLITFFLSGLASKDSRRFVSFVVSDCITTARHRLPTILALTALATLLGLVAASVLLPIETTSAEFFPADFSSTTPTPHGVKPEWYLFAGYALLAFTSLLLPLWIPTWCVGIMITFVAAHFFALPFVDTERPEYSFLSGFYTVSNLVFLAAWVVLTIIGGAL
jgi:cytochrome b6